MAARVRTPCLVGLAAFATAAAAQTVSNPVTLQVAPRPAPAAQALARAELPPGAAARDARLRAQTAPEELQWADRTAARNLSPEAMRAEVAKSWPDLDQASAEDLTFIVIMAAARDNEADLRAQMAAVRDSNDRKQAQREAQQGQPLPQASAGGLANQQSLRLQAELDRRNRLMDALTSLMKKADDTESSAAGNTK